MILHELLADLGFVVPVLFFTCSVNCWPNEVAVVVNIFSLFTLGVVATVGVVTFFCAGVVGATTNSK
jgi:hypothetical protein